jgi:hypothetical protein
VDRLARIAKVVDLDGKLWRGVQSPFRAVAVPMRVLQANQNGFSYLHRSMRVAGRGDDHSDQQRQGEPERRYQEGERETDASPRDGGKGAQHDFGEGAVEQHLQQVSLHSGARLAERPPVTIKRHEKPPEDGQSQRDESENHLAELKANWISPCAETASFSPLTFAIRSALKIEWAMASRWNILVLCLLLGGIALWASRSSTKPAPGPARQKVTVTQSPDSALPTPSQTTTTPEPEGDGKLPNLVVVDVIYEDPYLKVVYANQGGAHVSADFVISLSSDGKTFAGNTNYRNLVPTPGQRVVSGGFTPGLVGLKPVLDDIDPGPHGGFEEYLLQELRVTIDPEDRVREMDESDNTLVCGVHIAADGSEGYVQKQEWHVLQSVDDGSLPSRTDHSPDLEA